MNLHLTTGWLLKNRRSWIALFGLLLLALPLLRGGQLWAANIREINQTVPPPTATRMPTPVPPATATPKPPDQPTAAPTSSGNNQSSSDKPTQTPTAAPTATDRITGTVKTKNLNVRSGPGTGYSVIGALPQNTEIELMEQNEAGDWWFICCVPRSDIHGWVKAAFVIPNKDLAEIKKALPVTKEAVAAPSATPSTAVTATTTTTNAVTVSTASNSIQVTIAQSPTFPLQGDLVSLQISITNPTAKDANNVELRDELPTGMKIVSIEVTDKGTVSQDLTENLREVYSASWPTLKAGATVSVMVTVQIDAELPDGAVLDNLAFAGSADVTGSTAGLSIGMPPTDLPDFQ
ncbi:MAG: SH3 domain-containing protein [Caldilineaceae bacterium]